MNYEDLVRLIAKLWVMHGGDPGGFDRRIFRIRDAIVRLIDERDEVDE